MPMVLRINSIAEIPDSHPHAVDLSISGLITMLAITPVKVINNEPIMLFSQPRVDALYGFTEFPILSFMLSVITS